MKDNQMTAVMGQFLSRLLPITQYRGYNVVESLANGVTIKINGYRCGWTITILNDTNSLTLFNKFVKEVLKNPGDVMEANSWLEQLGVVERIKTEKEDKND